MKTSDAGRAKIEAREGRRLLAYKDTKGVLTIGVGHTGRMSPPKVTPGMTITAAQCDAMLAADLAPVEAAINKALKVPVSQNEFDALVSLYFNVGDGYVATSTIIKKLNLGDVAGAAAAFDLYHKPPEIIERRNSEKVQFLTPDPARPRPIEADRAQVLNARAQETLAKSKTNTQGGAAAVVIGTAAAATAATQGHSWHWAWIIGGIVAVGAIIDLIVTIAQRKTVATLANNAVAQAAVVAPPQPAPQGVTP